MEQVIYNIEHLLELVLAEMKSQHAWTKEQHAKNLEAIHKRHAAQDLVEKFYRDRVEEVRAREKDA